MIGPVLSSSNFVCYKKVWYFNGRFPHPAIFCMMNETSASLSIVLQLPRNCLGYCGGHKHMTITPHFTLQPIVPQPGIHRTPLWVSREIVTQINKKLDIPRKIPNIPQDFAGLFVRSCKYWSRLHPLQISSLLLFLFFFADNDTLD